MIRAFSKKCVTSRTGETAAEGGVREAREEAGVCSFIGEMRLLRVEQTESRFRWILHAQAATDALKTETDNESKGARWVTLHECEAIDTGLMEGVENCYLRGDEPLKWFEYVARGRPSFALSEFVQATTQKGATVFRGRATYKTSSEGRIAVMRKSSGLIAAFHHSGTLHTGAISRMTYCPSFFHCLISYFHFQAHSGFHRLRSARTFPSCRTCPVACT